MQRYFWQLRQGKAICKSLQQNAMISDMRVICRSYLQVSFSPEHAPRSVSLAHRSAQPTQPTQLTLLSTTLNDHSAIRRSSWSQLHSPHLAFSIAFLVPATKCQKVFLLVSHQTMNQIKNMETTTHLQTFSASSLTKIQNNFAFE